MEAEEKNKWGLSRQTNIAIAGIAAIQFVPESLQAILAITIIVLASIGCRQYQDIKKIGIKNEK